MITETKARIEENVPQDAKAWIEGATATIWESLWKEGFEAHEIKEYLYSLTEYKND